MRVKFILSLYPENKILANILKLKNIKINIITNIGVNTNLVHKTTSIKEEYSRIKAAVKNLKK